MVRSIIAPMTRRVAPTGRCKQRIEQSLASESMLLQPLLRKPPCFVHFQRLSEAVWIGNGMDELREHLRRKRKAITRCQQMRECHARRLVIGVFREFCGDEKAGVNSVSHNRPSSISPSKSSSGESGCRTRPTCTGAMSRTLCPLTVGLRDDSE